MVKSGFQCRWTYFQSLHSSLHRVSSGHTAGHLESVQPQATNCSSQQLGEGSAWRAVFFCVVTDAISASPGSLPGMQLVFPELLEGNCNLNFNTISRWEPLYLDLQMQRALKKVVSDGGGEDFLSLPLTFLWAFYCSLACTRHCLTSSLCTSLGLTSLSLCFSVPWAETVQPNRNCQGDYN